MMKMRSTFYVPCSVGRRTWNVYISMAEPRQVTGVILRLI